MSEAEYLEQQAADARAAMVQTVHEMGQTLQRQADQHPLLVLGAAAVAGALVACAFHPAGHDGAREKSPAAPSFFEGMVAETLPPLIQDLARTVVTAVARSFTGPAVDTAPPSGS
jgi:hypothetical protein